MRARKRANLSRLHGFHGTGGPYDITRILAASPEHPAWGPEGAFHWWGEPDVGYFLATDPWVIRRNLSMLQDAGVDALLCDVTNEVTYPDEVRALCGVAHQMRSEGSATPQASRARTNRLAPRVKRQVPLCQTRSGEMKITRGRAKST